VRNPIIERGQGREQTHKRADPDLAALHIVSFLAVKEIEEEVVCGSKASRHGASSEPRRGNGIIDPHTDIVRRVPTGPVH
jgi:hypothetical protein